MKEVSAEIEFNKTFLARPTLLLKYDRIIVDTSDVDEVFSRSNESAWQNIIKENLSFLEDQGLVVKRDLKQLISNEERLFIRSEGESIVSSMTTQAKQTLLEHAWRDFIEYVKIKMSYMDATSPLFKDQYLFLRSCEKDLLEIESGNWDSDIQDYILKQCFWKSYASIIGSKKGGDSDLYMAREYEPFVSLSHGRSNYYDQTRIQKIDQLVEYAYDLSLPSVSIDTLEQKYKFLILRACTLQRHKELCERLEELLTDVESRGLDINDAKALMREQWVGGVASLQPAYRQFSGLIDLLSIMIDIAVKAWSFMMPDILGQAKDTAKKHLYKELDRLKLSKIEWQAAFCKLFNESEIRRIDKEISKHHFSGAGGRLDYWRNNVGKLPWYANVTNA